MRRSRRSRASRSSSSPWARQRRSWKARPARIAFALATGYGSVPVGPGALSTLAAFEASTIADRIRTAFLEACVGETLAAVEVAEAAARAVDPVVRGALAAIAEDETEH